jgi:hypothetical protein
MVRGVNKAQVELTKTILAACHCARSVRSNWARGQYFMMRYMAMDTLGNRHAFPANVFFGTFGTPLAILNSISCFIYTFGALALFFFLASN